MSAIGTERGWRVTGWHVLAMICTFFAVIFAVDFSFMFKALKTFPGEVSVTPYEDGLIYDKTIAQLKAQEQLGWRMGAAAAPGVVDIVVHDRNGAPVRGLTITAKLERPATEEGRLHPRFAEIAPGRYEATLGGISGTWDLSADAHDPHGQRFVAERRLAWR